MKTITPVLASAHQERRFAGDLAARRGFGSARAFHRCRNPLWPPQRPCTGTMTTGRCDSIGYWREALFIASATHGEIPCGGKGW